MVSHKEAFWAPSLYHVYEWLTFWNWWPPKIKDFCGRFNNISCGQNSRICESAIGELFRIHSTMDRNHGTALNVAKSVNNYSTLSERQQEQKTFPLDIAECRGHRDTMQVGISSVLNPNATKTVQKSAAQQLLTWLFSKALQFRKELNLTVL